MELDSRDAPIRSTLGLDRKTLYRKLLCWGVSDE
jgi:transcriptional regulator of acetoin/glycerol metabolism